MPSYQYRKSHCGDKTVIRSSYLHNGISYTSKTTSLYWIRARLTYRQAQTGGQLPITARRRDKLPWIPYASLGVVAWQPPNNNKTPITTRPVDQNQGISLPIQILQTYVCDRAQHWPVHTLLHLITVCTETIYLEIMLSQGLTHRGLNIFKCIFMNENWCILIQILMMV